MKLLHVQTVLKEEDLEALKRKTGRRTTKDALYEAVVHYLSCPFAGREDDFGLKEKIEKKIKRAKSFQSTLFSDRRIAGKT
jgi:hypothetical protein